MNLSESSNYEYTDLANTAIRFINTTSSHIFLTGKAGTGKTTFLKELVDKTHKQFVVVAPTGIAALNAGGVTIHSQFLFPLGTFIPERSLPFDFNFSGGYFSQDILARKHPLNSARRQVLRSIDLLIIDEVSMLRADILDAIDYRLRSVKRNYNQSFGGVQLLFIGDLFQLPPVVKNEESHVLSKYYSSPWFYEAKAIKNDSITYIELDKIFRQQDSKFIDLLNKLRNSETDQQDIDLLNSYYRTADEISATEEIITLTTHNYKADELNAKALKSLDSPTHSFEARVTGDFPEHMFPVQQKLELKVGAQIMFIKNDTVDQAYFNGKLATVTQIRNTEIEVSLAETNQRYTLKKEIWENKKYSVDEQTRNLRDEVVGTFEQYPVKLAWAITVHKSQGLTFEKAIIDVGQAFADGQVYVALSRLRSLDGLILRTKVNTDVISTDKHIVKFSSVNNHPEKLPGIIRARQINYIEQLINQTFNFAGLLNEIDFKNKKNTGQLESDTMKPVLSQIKDRLTNERINTEKFRYQLLELLKADNESLLLERLGKGTEYYRLLFTECMKELLFHLAEMQSKKRVKTYLTHLADLDQLITRKLEEIASLVSVVNGILTGKDQFDLRSIKKTVQTVRHQLIDEIKETVGSISIKNKRSKKTDNRSTYEITLDLLNSGLTIQQIVTERGLVIGTIEGHLAKAVAEDKLSIHTFMNEEDVNCIADVVSELPEKFSSKDVFIKLDGKYGYGAIRAVLAHLKIKSVKSED
jgi:hypothetical protein